MSIRCGLIITYKWSLTMQIPHLIEFVKHTMLCTNQIRFTRLKIKSLEWNGSIIVHMRILNNMGPSNIFQDYRQVHELIGIRRTSNGDGIKNPSHTSTTSTDVCPSGGRILNCWTSDVNVTKNAWRVRTSPRHDRLPGMRNNDWLERWNSKTRLWSKKEM